MKSKNDFEDAKIKAIKELLSYSLNYDDDELESLNIQETKLSKRGDDIINVAFASEDKVKDLFIRKAELKNEYVTLRNYIPPNFHERFMHLNAVCSEKRSLEPNLKTQLRFGRRDIEIFNENEK